MTSALMPVAVIVLFGLLFVVVPVVFDAYNRYRERKVITCPETRSPADVALKTRLAAFGAAFGPPAGNRGAAVEICRCAPGTQGCRKKGEKKNCRAPGAKRPIFFPRISRHS